MAGAGGGVGGTPVSVLEVGGALDGYANGPFDFAPPPSSTLGLRPADSPIHPAKLSSHPMPLPMPPPPKRATDAPAPAAAPEDDAHTSPHAPPHADDARAPLWGGRRGPLVGLGKLAFGLGKVGFRGAKCVAVGTFRIAFRAALVAAAVSVASTAGGPRLQVRMLEKSQAAKATGRILARCWGGRYDFSDKEEEGPPPRKPSLQQTSDSSVILSLSLLLSFSLSLPFLSPLSLSLQGAAKRVRRTSRAMAMAARPVLASAADGVKTQATRLTHKARTLRGLGGGARSMALEGAGPGEKGVGGVGGVVAPRVPLPTVSVREDGRVPQPPAVAVAAMEAEPTIWFGQG